MTISTMEELEAVPVGDILLINEARWQREPLGLRCTEPRTGVVGTEAFTVAVATGQVSLVQAVTDQQAAALRAEVAQLTERVDILNRQRAEAERQRDAQRTAHVDLIDALGEWAREEGDIDSDLSDIFENHGIEWRGRETVTVSVCVSGETRVEFDDHTDISEIIGGGVSWDSNYESVRCDIGWTTDLHFEVEVEQGSCGCEDVDNDTVRARLSENSVNVGSFEIDERTCPNC